MVSAGSLDNQVSVDPTWRTTNGQQSNPIFSNFVPKWKASVPHPDSSSLQICSRQPLWQGLKKKQAYPRTRCSMMAITRLPSHVHCQMYTPTCRTPSAQPHDREINDKTKDPVSKCYLFRYITYYSYAMIHYHVKWSAWPGLNPLVVSAGSLDNRVSVDPTWRTTNGQQFKQLNGTRAKARKNNLQ